MVLTEIMTFIGVVMSGVFTMLDTVYIDGSISVLDVLIAILFLDVTIWFILRILHRDAVEGES